MIDKLLIALYTISYSLSSLRRLETNPKPVIAARAPRRRDEVDDWVPVFGSSRLPSTNVDSFEVAIWVDLSDVAVTSEWEGISSWLGVITFLKIWVVTFPTKIVLTYS